MTERRVVVTGVGAVSCDGNSMAELWANLVAGKSGIGIGDLRKIGMALNEHFGRIVLRGVGLRQTFAGILHIGVGCGGIDRTGILNSILNKFFFFGLFGIVGILIRILGIAGIVDGRHDFRGGGTVEQHALFKFEDLDFLLFLHRILRSLSAI